MGVGYNDGKVAFLNDLLEDDVDFGAGGGLRGRKLPQPSVNPGGPSDVIAQLVYD